MSHKKLHLTLIIITIILLSAILPPLLIPKVKSGIVISDELTDEVLLAVDIHFDHPIQELALRYQIIEMNKWEDSESYTVVGRTLFGIRFTRTVYYMGGGISTIPSFMNDLINN